LSTECEGCREGDAREDAIARSDAASKMNETMMDFVTTTTTAMLKMQLEQQQQQRAF